MGKLVGPKVSQIVPGDEALEVGKPRAAEGGQSLSLVLGARLMGKMKTDSPQLLYLCWPHQRHSYYSSYVN